MNEIKVKEIYKIKALVERLLAIPDKKIVRTKKVKKLVKLRSGKTILRIQKKQYTVLQALGKKQNQLLERKQEQLKQLKIELKIS